MIPTPKDIESLAEETDKRDLDTLRNSVIEFLKSKNFIISKNDFYVDVMLYSKSVRDKVIDELRGAYWNVSVYSSSYKCNPDRWTITKRQLDSLEEKFIG
jgi:hypothetical protein